MRRLLFCTTFIFMISGFAFGEKCPSRAIPGFPGDFTADCYLYERFPTQFVTAERMCRLSGGQLVSISDDFVNAFVAQGGVEAFSIMSKKSFWIGGHDLHKISKWEWVDDSPWKYTKWDENQPSNESSLNRCVAMYLDEGVWKVEDCFERKPYICALRFIDANSTTAASRKTTSVYGTTMRGITELSSSGIPTEVTKLSSSTVEPIDFTTKLDSSTVEPIDFTTDLSSSTVEPIDFTSKLSSSTVKPIDFTTKLASSTNEPIDFTTDLSSSTVEPIDFTTELALSTNEPIDFTTDLNEISTTQQHTTELAEFTTLKSTIKDRSSSTNEPIDFTTKLDSSTIEPVITTDLNEPTKLASSTVEPIDFTTDLNEISTILSSIETSTNQPSTNNPSTIKTSTNQPSTDKEVSTTTLKSSTLTDKEISTTTLKSSTLTDKAESTTSLKSSTLTDKKVSSTLSSIKTSTNQPDKEVSTTSLKSSTLTDKAKSTTKITTFQPSTSTTEISSTTEEVLIYPCPDEHWVYEGGQCYFGMLSDGWENDEAKCRSLGSFLVSMHNRTQNSYVKFISHQSPKTKGKIDVTIGLREVLNNGKREWRWVDGSPVDFTNWASGFDTQPSGPLKCATYWTSTNNPQKVGLWRYVECDKIQAQAVCMQPANFEHYPSEKKASRRPILRADRIDFKS